MINLSLLLIFVSNIRPNGSAVTQDQKVTGCEYKLLESEILDWLAIFEKVLTEMCLARSNLNHDH